MKKSITKFFVLLSLFITTGAIASPVQFEVRPDGEGQGIWSFNSQEPRPMLYLVTLKAGSEEPKDCDDGQDLFAVRDVLSYESDTFIWPNADSATVQLCVLNVHGFVEQRFVLSFKL